MEDKIIKQAIKKYEQTSDFQMKLYMTTSIQVIYDILKENNLTNERDWNKRFVERESEMRKIALEKEENSLKEKIEKNEEYKELIKQYGDLIGEK